MPASFAREIRRVPMFEKREQLSYREIMPDRIVSSRLVKSPQALVGGSGNTVFLCEMKEECNLLIDFHEEIVGGLELVVQCSAPAHITVIVEEESEWAMRRDPFISSWYEQIKDEYNIEPGQHTLKSHGRRGFRFAGIFVESEKNVELISAKAITGHWPVKHIGAFRCSDGRLNKIWDIAARTSLSCMQEFYEDGVKRDGLLWLGDYRLSFLSAYYLFGDIGLARKCLYIMKKAQYENGAIPACVARGGGEIHTEPWGISYMPTIPESLNAWIIPNYMCEYLYSIEEYVHITGDISILPDFLPSAEAALKFMIGMSDLDSPGKWRIDAHSAASDRPAIPDENGFTYLIEYDCTMNPATSVGSKGALLLGMLGSAKALAHLAKKGGNEELENWAILIEERFEKHIETYYKDPETGQYLDTVGQSISDTLQLAAIQAVLAGKKDLQGMKQLKRSVLPTWGYMLSWKPAVMFQEGEAKAALEIIRNAWGKMLDADSLTCWERLDYYERSRTHYYEAPVSMCHGWTAGPAWELPKWIAGIQCEEDGFAAVRVQPNLIDMDWAEATVPTPYGEIVSRIERWEDGQKLYLNIPEGIRRCTVCLSGQEMLLENPGYHVIQCKNLYAVSEM